MIYLALACGMSLAGLVAIVAVCLLVESSQLDGMVDRPEDWP